MTHTGTVTSEGFTIGSAAIVEAELEQLDTVTAGTKAANKAVVLGATAAIDSWRVLGGETVDGTVIAGNVTTTGTTTTVDFVQTGATTRASQSYTYALAKAGAAAGWTVNAGANLWTTTMAQSQTSGTLVIPITGLHVGDIITNAHLVGQVESGGNNVVIELELRKITAAASAVTDAIVGSRKTVATLTADTILSAANTAIGTQAETVGADETFYILVYATTAATTDIDLMGTTVIVTQK